MLHGAKRASLVATSQHALLAQLVEAPDLGSGGSGFDSPEGHATAAQAAFEHDGAPGDASILMRCRSEVRFLGRALRRKVLIPCSSVGRALDC